MRELPVTLALVAGAVAAVNPCGFALLPAYLGLLVADDPGEEPARTTPSRVGRALLFALCMTAGFVAVFGIFGAAVAPLALSVERYLPVVTVVVGVALAVLGAWMLMGRTLAVPGLARAGRAPGRTWRSQVVYGVSFALVSLSCTVAPFLAVTSTALRAGSVPGVVVTFVAYAVGMGVVVAALAVAVAGAHEAVTRAMRRAGGALSRVGAALLVVAGLYVAWYGWFEIRVLSGGRADDPIVAAATRIQARLARTVADVDPAVLVGLGACLVIGALLLTGRRPLRNRRSVP